MRDHAHTLSDFRVPTLSIECDDVTAVFRIAYDVAIRRCDLCARCGKAPISKALLIKDPVGGAVDSPSKLIAVCDACYDAGRGAPLSRPPPPAAI
jgi:hypothetical protein